MPDLAPSYKLSKNLLLLPWILKFIVDMVNDSTPLIEQHSVVKPFYLVKTSPEPGDGSEKDCKFR